MGCIPHGAPLLPSGTGGTLLLSELRKANTRHLFDKHLFFSFVFRSIVSFVASSLLELGGPSPFVSVHSSQ
jgi:hypothetical protein